MLSVATHVNKEANNIVSFNWNVIDQCQLKCSYCYATDFNKQKSFSHQQNTASYVFVLARLKQLNFDWEIDIQGGEPTLHPNLSTIVRELNTFPRCKRITLATNCAPPVHYFDKFDTPSTKVELHVSYHPEYHVDLFNKIMKLHKRLQHVLLFVEVILHPKRQYFNQVADFVNDLKKHNIQFGVTVVNQNEFWDGVYDEGFTELVSRCSSDVDTHYCGRLAIHQYSDGTVEGLTELDIIQSSITYTGFLCRQLMYTIDVDGTFTNTCTNQRVNRPVPAENDMNKFIKCPRVTTCSCSAMFFYEKVKA